MNLDSAQPQSSMREQWQASTGTRLQGRWLVFLRIAWGVLFVLALGLFVVRVPFNFADAHSICSTASCANGVRLSPENVQELRRLGLSIDSYAYFSVSLALLFEFVLVAIGANVFWRTRGKPDERMALLSAFALVGLAIVFQNNPAPSIPQALLVPSLSLIFLGNTCLGLFFCLFPTGHFAPRWTRWLAVIWIVYHFYNNLILGSLVNTDGPGSILFLGLLASFVAVQVYHYRRISTPVQRQQTKWVVFGVSVALLGFLILMILPVVLNIPPTVLIHVVVGCLLYFFLLLIPLSIGMAMLRSRLWDVDILINRTLVYGTLTASIIALYVLLIVSLGYLLQSSGNLLISLFATGVVAVAFQPLRERLQGTVNRLMYGERDTPYKVISRLGRRLEATLSPDAILLTIVETVAQALKLPYVAISLQQEGTLVIAASYGTTKEELLHLPLVYQTESVGELALAPRATGETFSPADLRLLEDLALQVGVVAHSVLLTSELQHMTEELRHSRTQLVTTREEERRRLRRDLHDGLGSALTSVTFQLDAASNLLDSDIAAVRALLQELKTQMQSSIADIRRLVYNLRPPILDEWGLVAALREQVAQYQLNAVQVTVDAPETFPALPAAVEVAAYRIALEALANVVRHAHATTCTISLHVSADILMLEIRDNGAGLPPGHHAGVGISAMRERAAELGGSCIVEPVEHGGTRVYAQMPLLEE